MGFIVLLSVCRQDVRRLAAERQERDAKRQISNLQQDIQVLRQVLASHGVMTPADWASSDVTSPDVALPLNSSASSTRMTSPSSALSGCASPSRDKSVMSPGSHGASPSSHGSSPGSHGASPGNNNLLSPLGSATVASLAFL